LAVLGGLLLVGSAAAHAKYLRSAPGENGMVSSPPARVDIWFTQELFRRKGENRILVFGPGEQAAQAGEAQVDDDDRTHLWVELLPDLAPGLYRVEWRSLSAEDGDSDQGVFSFTFDPQARQTSTPMGAGSPGSPTVEPGDGQPTAFPTGPLPEQGTAPASPTAEILMPTPSQTPPASSTGPGGGCLPGSMPVAGLVVVTWILRQRRMASP
jgi:methionine-rich copper-binding protein CopC